MIGTEKIMDTLGVPQRLKRTRVSWDALHELILEGPVIMLTARGYSLDDEDLELCNLRDVLSKPFSPRTILQYVLDTLAESGQERRESA